MKYDRDFLENVHNDIKADMAAIGLVPHYRNGNLLTLPQNSYGCDFCTLRYWRKNDMALIEMTKGSYNYSCLEVRVTNNRLYISIWFGEHHKKDKLILSSRKNEIIDKRNEYTNYKWVDENGTLAPTDEKLIQWLCETSHETVFRKELASYNKDAVVSEMRHLKEYLDILL